MSESNKSAKLDSIKLVYNEKTKRIVANLITIVDGVKVRSRTIDNIEVIKVLIDALVKQSKLPVSELVDNGIILVDDRLVDKGVIILDSSKEYHKYIFNKENGVFESIRLTRMEKKELGILTEDESYESLPEVKEDDITKEDTPTVDVISNEKIVDNQVLTSEDVSESKESLPEVVIDDKLEEDGAIDVSEVSDEHVVTKEEKTKGVRNLKINKKALLALGLVPVICASSIFLSRKNNGDSYITYNKNSYNGQKSISTTVELPSEPEIIVPTGLNSSVVPTPEPIYEPSVPQPTATIEPPIVVDASVPVYKASEFNIDEEPAENLSVNDFDEEKAYVEYITQRINDMCATCVPCKFYDLIDNSDMSTIRVINDARNIALNDRDKLIDLMDYYVKYICEGTVMFENGVVKGYDYLSPLAKYAVLVSGQTLLPLCPDYNYSTMNGVYTYESLFDEFDSRINEVYSEMLTKGKTI